MKLSIITINLNNKEGLRRTIESVLSQSFKGFEYLLIDGGSTDGSKDIIKEFEEDIKYSLSEPDSGIYNAMNKGIKKAKGDYLQFLNSGDCFAGESVLEDIFKNELPEGLIYTDGFIMGKRKNVVPVKLPAGLDLMFLIDHSIIHAGSFIPRKLFNEPGLYNEEYKIISDTEFFIKAYLKGIHFHKLDLATIVTETDGISRINGALVREEKKQMIDSLFGEPSAELYSGRENISADLVFLKQAKLIRFLLSHKGNNLINKLLRIF
jgi:glycosyltransferase involved in cell wall biosynthesis